MPLSSWKAAIPLLRSGYAETLLEATRSLRDAATIYPPHDQVLYALEVLPFDNVSVVILGQDPYHGDGQAHGLAFSVPDGVRPPPSLQNIFKEINRDLYPKAPKAFHSDLTGWASQGVLLMNTILTVEAGKPGSHKHIGWGRLTDQIISELSDRHAHLVFMLWGGPARSKAPLIDREKHLVLEAPHPSPLSAYRGFIGCGHFSSANAYLKRHERPQIAW